MASRKDRYSSRKNRTISGSLAPIIEQLELKGENLVILDDLRAIRPDSPDATIRRIAHELVERCWFEPLTVKGAYEFIPGAAAGAYRSGDPWLDLKAALRLNADLQVHVGFSSAAWLRGYKPRAPDRQIVVGTRQPKPPPSLSKVYTVVKTDGNRLFGSEQLKDFPVATVERILVEAVWRPDLMDLRTDIGWLSKLIFDATPTIVVDYLEKLSVKSAWSRAGYLVDIVDHSELRDMIRLRFPSPAGPFYLGDSSLTDHYVSEWRLYDNVGLWKLNRNLANNDY